VQPNQHQAYVWYGRAATSATTIVQRAAWAGMQAMARQMDPTQLAAAAAALATWLERAQ